MKTMIKLSLALLALILPACFRPTAFVGPNGRSETFISCNQKVSCLVRAGRECPLGYTEVNALQVSGDSFPGYQMIIECKGG